MGRAERQFIDLFKPEQDNGARSPSSSMAAIGAHCIRACTATSARGLKRARRHGRRPPVTILCPTVTVADIIGPDTRGDTVHVDAGFSKAPVRLRPFPPGDISPAPMLVTDWTKFDSSAPRRSRARPLTRLSGVFDLNAAPWRFP